MDKKMNKFLSILSKSNISFNWETIRIGINRKFLDNKDIIDYAIDYLAKHPDENNKLIIALAAAEISDENIPNLLDKIINLKTTKLNRENEKRKWRYAILKDLSNRYKNKKSENEIYPQLMEIDSIGQDFGCPADMQPLIYYLSSPNDPPLLGIEGLRNRFEEFVKKEKKELREIN